ncbi:hypothetical protein [Fodinibius sp.]|uniref:hypothetical protein n=1 Tax=Fodinibius sp. TaxID=1872440 RepID=UPI002ACDC5BB|nr:hypothetical protein [Fodinibius sp.]MDZ7660082.1 hypothetical protein [Fodinibius sp.]
METVINAEHSGGEIAAMLPLEPGAHVSAGQVIALITPAADGQARSSAERPAQDTWADVLDEVHTLQRLAHERLAAGSTEPGVVRQRDRGKLTCRERIDAVLDAGSFREAGSIRGLRLP